MTTLYFPLAPAFSPLLPRPGFGKKSTHLAPLPALQSIHQPTADVFLCPSFP